jgi:hypothetical protein
LYSLEKNAMKTCPDITARCCHCGGRLEHFEGDAYCPDCTTYTLAVDVVDVASAGDDNPAHDDA